MPVHATIPQIVAIIVGLIGSATDIKTGKIYNVLTLPAALVGIVLCSTLGALEPIDPVHRAIANGVQSILGWVLAVAIMVALKKLLGMKEIGFGDVKLLGALGTFLGPPLTFAAFIYFCFVFGAWTMGVMAFAFPWKQLMFAYTSKDMRVMDLSRFEEVRKSALPMGPFITAGLIIAVLTQDWTLKFMGIIK